MSRVLITGAEGFTGHYLAKMLHERGHEVHGLVLRRQNGSGAAALPHFAATHACDLLDEAGVARLMQTLRPEKVAHLAGIAFVGHGQIEDFYRVNIVGTRHLLAALAATDATPSAVLLASSANVYGNGTEGVLDESVPPAPANDYAVSKLAMEFMARTWQAQLPITIARPFNYTGVGQSEDFLLPKIVAHIKRRALSIELGNLDVERDFSDVRTVADVYCRLLQGHATGQALNVCSGQPHSLRSVFNLAAELGGHRPEVRVNPAFVRANEVHQLLGSKSALEHCIGPVQGPSLQETLTWMLQA